jgi:hypothetical protein
MTSVFRMTTVLCLILAACTAGSAQYFGERVMEKSFEQTDFFFTPFRLVPYGIGDFRQSVAGLLEDPLLNLDLNPSYLYGDTAHSSYGYIDFRSSRDIRDRRDIYFPYPVFDAVGRDGGVGDVRSILPYPYFYVRTRRELEPVVSAAYLFRSTHGALRNLSLGVTYQLVAQDDRYYPIPQDIYRTVLGADYMGTRAAGAEDIPIVDRFSGTDNIHQEGHFASFFAGYELTPQFQIGAKLGRVSFDRDGSYGSQNIWDNYYWSNNTSLWRNSEARNQSYRHWELIGGASYAVDENTNIGLSAGRVWGTADQVLTRDDSSYWSYGTINSMSENWGLYSSSGFQDQSWNHDGGTTLLGANLRSRISPTQLFQLHYQYSRQSIDIALSGLIDDTSFGRSRWGWDTTIYNSSSYSAVFDQRAGSGTTEGNFHRALASLQWNIGTRTTLMFGFQYENRSVETNTSESVLARRHSRYASTGTYPYDYFDSTAESKQLEWAFRTRLSRFTIPIFLSYRASDVVELLFGLNRSASTWRVDDVTLARFAYRARANQQGSEFRTNFGERYTQPPERVSDVRTRLLAGLTVAPSTAFNVRLLVVPNYEDTYRGTEFSDLQWWIAVNLLP